MMAMAAYALAVALLGALVMFGRRSMWSVLAFALFIAAAWGAALDGMGEPKPIWAEWRPMDKIAVVAAHFDPGEAIYIWAAGKPPVAYEMPWSADNARKLQEALSQTDPGGGQKVIVQGEPYGEWMVYPEPYQELPSKRVDW